MLPYFVTLSPDMFRFLSPKTNHIAEHQHDTTPTSLVPSSVSAKHGGGSKKQIQKSNKDIYDLQNMIIQYCYDNTIYGYFSTHCDYCCSDDTVVVAVVTSDTTTTDASIAATTNSTNDGNHDDRKQPYQNPTTIRYDTYQELEEERQRQKLRRIYQCSHCLLYYYCSLECYHKSQHYKHCHPASWLSKKMNYVPSLPYVSSSQSISDDDDNENNQTKIDEPKQQQDDTTQKCELETVSVVEENVDANDEAQKLPRQQPEQEQEHEQEQEQEQQQQQQQQQEPQPQQEVEPQQEVVVINNDEVPIEDQQPNHEDDGKEMQISQNKKEEKQEQHQEDEVTVNHLPQEDKKNELVVDEIQESSDPTLIIEQQQQQLQEQQEAADNSVEIDGTQDQEVKDIEQQQDQAAEVLVDEQDLQPQQQLQEEEVDDGMDGKEQEEQELQNQGQEPAVDEALVMIDNPQSPQEDLQHEPDQDATLQQHHQQEPEETQTTINDDGLKEKTIEPWTEETKSMDEPEPEEEAQTTSNDDELAGKTNEPWSDETKPMDEPKEEEAAVVPVTSEGHVEPVRQLELQPITLNPEETMEKHDGQDAMGEEGLKQDVSEIVETLDKDLAKNEQLVAEASERGTEGAAVDNHGLQTWMNSDSMENDLTAVTRNNDAKDDIEANDALNGIIPTNHVIHDLVDNDAKVDEIQVNVKNSSEGDIGIDVNTIVDSEAISSINRGNATAVLKPERDENSAVAFNNNIESSVTIEEDNDPTADDYSKTTLQSVEMNSTSVEERRNEVSETKLEESERTVVSPAATDIVHQNEHSHSTTTTNISDKNLEIESTPTSKKAVKEWKNSPKSPKLSPITRKLPNVAIIGESLDNVKLRNVHIQEQKKDYNWQKPEWAESDVSRDLTAIARLESKTSSISTPHDDQDGTLKDDVKLRNVQRQESKDYIWEKPEWADIAASRDLTAIEQLTSKSTATEKQLELTPSEIEEIRLRHAEQSTKKEYEWEKPEWVVKATLRPTTAESVVTSNIGPTNKVIVWEKPDWTKGKQALRKTNKVITDIDK